MTEYLFETESTSEPNYTGIWILADNPRQGLVRACQVASSMGIKIVSLLPKRIGIDLNPAWVKDYLRRTNV